MDFELTELQTELAAGIKRLCQGVFALEQLRTHEGAERVIDRAGWRQLGEAGVFALRLGEESGGVGLGLAEAALVFEELGRALVPGPLVATHLAAGLVDGAEAGSVVVGLIEPVTGGPECLPMVVEDLEDLDALVVLAPDGLTSVDPRTLDATRLDHPMDPFTPVWTVDRLPPGEPLAGPEVAAQWRRDGSVLTAALQVGSAGWSTDLAVEYAKARRQFGRPIGGFQAVKHLCADMAVRTELARCAVHAAAVTIDQPDVGDSAAAAAGAKLLADEAGLANGRSCIQVHGGMGFTWEVPAHLAYKRSRVQAMQFGTADQLAESLAESLAETLAVAAPGAAPSATGAGLR
jgi:alkylation response protein AidB-like acyl-CoA dehydrogenase